MKCFNPLPSCEGRQYHLRTSRNHHHASIHFPLAREDRVLFGSPFSRAMLQSTFLLRGKTRSTIRPNFLAGLLQSTCLLRGKTDRPADRAFHDCRFNPLPSCDGRQHSRSRWLFVWRFNPLPSCEGRPFQLKPHKVIYDASIHFPLAREDPCERTIERRIHASIHFPLAREDTLHPSVRRLLRASIHFPLARED